MYLHYGMSKETWKEFIDCLNEMSGVTILSYPRVNDNGLFEYFEYVYFEKDGVVYGCDSSYWDFTVTVYKKLDAFKIIQCDYPKAVYSLGDVIRVVNSNSKRVLRPVPDVYKKGLFDSDMNRVIEGKTALWRLKNEIAGYREKDVLNNLDRIELIQNTKDYRVLRFVHKDGEHFFDYECNTRRIVG